MDLTLRQFSDAFRTEQACLDFLESLYGLACRHCGHEKSYRLKERRTYKCAKCRRKFTLRIGTIFERSKISLPSWFMAIYLLNTARKGISSVELADKLGVTQKTAWFMYYRIRQAHSQEHRAILERGQ